nr:Os10g0467850 [Ipomoea trifida]
MHKPSRPLRRLGLLIPQRKLLVPPPLVEASPAPVHFQKAGGENADEESQEPQAGSIVQLRSNEFSCEETHGWEGTAASISIPERAMPAQEDLG